MPFTNIIKEMPAKPPSETGEEASPKPFFKPIPGWAEMGKNEKAAAIPRFSITPDLDPYPQKWTTA
jgi:hypothetical protein